MNPNFTKEDHWPSSQTSDIKHGDVFDMENGELFITSHVGRETPVLRPERRLAHGEANVFFRNFGPTPSKKHPEDNIVNTTLKEGQKISEAGIGTRIQQILATAHNADAHYFSGDRFTVYTVLKELGLDPDKNTDAIKNNKSPLPYVFTSGGETFHARLFLSKRGLRFSYRRSTDTANNLNWLADALDGGSRRISEK